MLVLSRKPGETLVIGDKVVVTIVDVENGRVRIGISAPKAVEIRRGELPPRPNEVVNTIFGDLEIDTTEPFGVS